MSEISLQQLDEHINELINVQTLPIATEVTTLQNSLTSTIDSRINAKYSSNSTISTNNKYRGTPPSVQWWQGRDYATFGVTSSGNSAYAPFATIRASTGTWEIGCYQNNTLHFTFVNDSCYNGGSNSAGEGFLQFSLTPDLSSKKIVIAGT